MTPTTPPRKEEPTRPDFDAVARTAIDLMPTDGDLDAFITNVSAHYDRPVVITEFDPYDPTEAAPADAPHGLTGYYQPQQTEDHIYVSQHSPPGQRASILLHELSHLFFLAAATPTLGLSFASRYWNREGYDSPDEEDAERLGTLLRDELTRRQSAARRHADPRAHRLR